MSPKRLLIFLILLLLPIEGFADNATANQKACVVAGKARFTVLTPQLIRMEWAEDGKFEDRATLGIVNRDLPVPAFKVSRGGNKIKITTDCLQLEYKGDDAFSEKNLKVSFRMGKKKITWTPASEDSGNLLGTTRTLDRYDGFTINGQDGILTTDPYDKGVASRDGWALIDESNRHVFTEDGWVDERPEGDRCDWYLFAYGHDYIQAVSDFTKVAGKIPLPPKYAFGYWWSRYWLYNDFELEDVVHKLRGYGLPADVFIIDMDWHETWGLAAKVMAKDDAGQRKGWTGYTWNQSLFPSPENTLTYLHDNGFKTSLNLHPASGIQTYEECYPSFVKDYSARTGEQWPEGEYVPYRMSQKAWAESYFQTVLHPIQKQGVDFWWLDWQQWRESNYIKGLSNTFWLNHTFFDDSSQGNHRPMIYHRWGGIGSHRYQVGFSGDTRTSWHVLSYMPWFFATASNVGYCYWGQDIGGHNEIPGQNYTDPELFTRWVQEGVFTPIFKTHPTRNSNLERRFWMFTKEFDILKEAVRLRYSLSPYIYTAARQAYDTGIGLCRPLYYYYPEAEEAYSFREEYLFGDDILATVVCRPCDPSTGEAERTVWFPSGNGWFDMSTGTMYEGGTVRTLHYAITENPWFARESALVPMASETIQSLQEKSDELVILAVPGKDSFCTRLYEDEGDNKDYDKSYSFTPLSREWTGNGIRIKVGQRNGSYEGALTERRLRVKLAGFEAPEAVRVNGKELPYSRFPKEETWTYDGASLTLIVYAGSHSADSSAIIECDGDFVFVSGESGKLKRARAKAEAVKNAQNAEDKYKWPDDEKMQWIGAASAITETPSRAQEILSSLPRYPFAEAKADAFPWQADTLGNGLRLLSFEGKLDGKAQRIHITEISPNGEYRLGFGYSDEELTVGEYGEKHSLAVVTTATFGLPHSYVRVNGQNYSEISIDSSNPRWWMHEAAISLDGDGSLSFLPFEGKADDAVKTYRDSEAKSLLSSAPMLVFEGNRMEWTDEGKKKAGFINGRYPRNVLAQLWDGRILIVSVDGKEPSVAEGMTLEELRDFLMAHFFVKNAINLDGSAAMFVEGKGNVCLKGTERKLNTFIEVGKVR